MLDDLYLFTLAGNRQRRRTANLVCCRKAGAFA